MTSKSEKDKAKQLQDKCQTVLTELLRDEDNKYCVDCDSKGPRWASWNIGVFLCIRCAGIHRNLGVHISKVKSVNLDTWTPEQVVSLQQMGNSRARAVYEANIPDNFRRPQNDASLETFIRAKYEHKKYIAKEWVPLPLPKVNWEKEIEEEMERQKRKKKAAVEKKSLGIVEVPQLPKPKNPSPKPARSNNQTAPEDKQVDLLALQNGEEGFSNFLSAPVKEDKKEENLKEVKETGSKTEEEESFFNQTAPTEKEKAKMTKDSILALYGNMPAVNNFNPIYSAQSQQVQVQQMPPFSNYPTQQQFQNYNFPQQQNFAIQNGQNQQQFSNQFAKTYPSQFNQFAAPQGVAVPNQPVVNQMQFHNQQFQSNVPQFAPVTGQYPAQNFGAVKPGVANPFFGTQTGLQQQFSNLSLNGQNNTNTTPTLASNIWQ